MAVSAPDRLYFTDSDEANALIASDPFALLVGFALDQQVTVLKAFTGPLVLKERLGTLNPAVVATADLEPLFRQVPAIHRFPGAMAERVHELAEFIMDGYGGDAARVWTDATTSEELRANIAALPGFGEMKIKALGSVLAKRFGVELAEPLIPWHPTLGDVDSPAALSDYQASKKLHKAKMRAERQASTVVSLRHRAASCRSRLRAARLPHPRRAGLRGGGNRGGRVEPGETIAETAVRELAEETGLEVRVERELDVLEQESWRVPGVRDENHFVHAVPAGATEDQWVHHRSPPLPLDPATRGHVRLRRARRVSRPASVTRLARR